jgi:Fe-S oxidoreductase
MCPSYRVTGNERDLTRGRANTLRLALSGQLGAEAESDDAVREALSLCVSCKGCRRECPTGVDMARMKIEFTRAIAPATAIRCAIASSATCRATRPGPRACSRSSRPCATSPGAWSLAARAIGFDPRRPLPEWRGSWLAKAADLRLTAVPVALFADTFNNWFEHENLDAALRVLTATGHRVTIARAADSRPLCCGRTYLSAGMVDRARVEAQRVIEALRPFAEKGVPVLGLEPSCLFTFRDEYAALLPGLRDAELLARNAFLADEYLAAEIAAGRVVPPWKAPAAKPFKVHGHCHQKAFATFDATLALLRTVPGAQVEAIESSCCGMAGSFGHEAGHYDTSMKMGELALLPAVRAAPEAHIVAAGTSCRHQIAHGAQRRASHPLAALAEHL